MPENLPAYSLVTAPDFLPLADQVEVEADDTIERVRPLSKGRLPVNPTLPRPSNVSKKSFPDRTDTTVTAVLGGVASGRSVSILGQPKPGNQLSAGLRLRRFRTWLGYLSQW